jgi:hypothetical protein
VHPERGPFHLIGHDEHDVGLFDLLQENHPREVSPRVILLQLHGIAL